MDVVTLAARPELADSAFGIPCGTEMGAFMKGNLAGLLTRPVRLARRWRFDADGEVPVPGALAPVWVSTRRNVAAYVEPNVWVLHTLLSCGWVSCCTRS